MKTLKIVNVQNLKRFSMVLKEYLGVKNSLVLDTLARMHGYREFQFASKIKPELLGNAIFKISREEILISQLPIWLKLLEDAFGTEVHGVFDQRTSAMWFLSIYYFDQVPTRRVPVSEPLKNSDNQKLPEGVIEMKKPLVTFKKHRRLEQRGFDDR
jgi:hypothetical protein